MPSRRDPRNPKIWFFRKVVRHPITGERVELFGSGYSCKTDSDDAELAEIEKLKVPEKLPVPTLDDWFNGRFWTEWVLGGPRGANSPSEQEAKRLIYGKHIKPFFGSLPLDRIDVERINTFRAALRARRRADGTTPMYSEKTINNILAVLSTPLQYAVKAGLLLRAPHVGVAKVERPEIDFIEFDEVVRLHRAACDDAQPWVRLAFLLDYEAGLRIGEIRALQYSGVDMKARTITVSEQTRTVAHEREPQAELPEPSSDAAEKQPPVGKYAYKDVTGKPKGRRRRIVPMTPALYEALRDRVRVGYVVAAGGGKPVTKEMVRCAIDRIAKRAGLADRVTGWHIGRHTYATHLAMLGVNPWDLNQWMGHTRLEETLRYADVARAHGRSIPSEVLSAGDREIDPQKRILAQLSARLALEPTFVAAPLQQKGGSRDRDAAFSRGWVVTPPGLEPGISA